MPPRVHDASLGLHISGSRMRGFVDCKRKWAFEYVAGIVPPPSEGQAEGTCLHWIGENWLRHGIPPNLCPVHPAANDDAEGRKVRLRVFGPAFTGADIQRIHDRMVPVFKPGVRHLPPPATVPERTGRLHVEHPGALPLDCGGTFTGTMDALELGAANDDAEIFDHKKTKQFTWAKTPAQLMRDPQALGYAKLALAAAPKAEVIRGRWVYYRSTGTPMAKPVRWKMDRAHIERGWRRINVVAAEMWQLWRAQVDPMDVPPSGYDPNDARQGMCGGFGGCFFKPMCHKDGKPKMSNGADGSDLFGELSKKGAGLGAAAGRTPPETDGGTPDDDDGSGLFEGADDVEVNPRPRAGATPGVPANLPKDAAALMAAALAEKSKAKAPPAAEAKPTPAPAAEKPAAPADTKPRAKKIKTELTIDASAPATIDLGTHPVDEPGPARPTVVEALTLASSRHDLVAVLCAVEVASAGRLRPADAVARARDLLAALDKGEG